MPVYNHPRISSIKNQVVGSNEVQIITHMNNYNNFQGKKKQNLRSNH